MRSAFFLEQAVTFQVEAEVKSRLARAWMKQAEQHRGRKGKQVLYFGCLARAIYYQDEARLDYRAARVAMGVEPYGG